MKAEIMYSVHNIAHPWDAKARKEGVMVYCLCREVRLPVMPGLANGHQVSWEPVALFNLDSEARMFDRFCITERNTIIPSYGTKELVEEEQRFSESRSKKSF